MIHTFMRVATFCHLLITFANSFYPDQDRHYVCPDLDPNSLTLLTVLLKEFFENVKLKKKTERKKYMKKCPACKEFKYSAILL